MAHNFIIHQHASQYQWSGDCFLSIKSFYNGSAKYTVQQREYSVNQHNYLILNDCTNYNLTIDNETPIESFCVFFTPEFVCSVISELNASEEQLLDGTIKKSAGVKLLERNYLHGGDVSNILFRAKQTPISGLSGIEKDEFYHTLLTAILFQNSEALKKADSLSLKKSSTREEIYRRLQYARDFIDCNFTDNLTLKKISDVAMLSENHFLRNFNEVFNFSPFQYITQLKMAEAKRLIIETDKSVTEVALTLGYSSLSNFSAISGMWWVCRPLRFEKR